jgi:GntR family transcriptional regulator/MocR family aminotransferase
MAMLSLRLDGEGTLQRQLYRALRDAILGGRLPPGSRLPGTRALGRELGLSRNTVLLACEQLLAEGSARPRPRSGTFVVDALPARPRDAGHGLSLASGRTPAPPPLSAVGRRLADAVAPGRASWSPWAGPLPYDFRYGEPSYADLPLETWTRLLGRRARRLSVRRLAYQAPGGAAELREALAGYLARARGVVCSPEQIVVVNGSQQAIDLTTRLLVDPGTRVVLEEPHYTGFSVCLRAAGAAIDYVPVDEAGLRTDLLARVRRARLACVTPSHQYPAGSVLSLPRRLALLDWAARCGAYLLEDDYDGEFRFDGKPIACLQALDRTGRVIYTGTASKLLFPALRIGWLVAPPALAPHFLDTKALADTGTPTLEQLALADLIAGGHLERHARRARIRTATRRAVLLDAVGTALGTHARIRGASAGLHVLLELPAVAARDVSRLRMLCRQRGVGIYPAAPFYAHPPAHAELLLGYAALDETQIREGIRRLREALDGLRASHATSGRPPGS